MNSHYKRGEGKVGRVFLGQIWPENLLGLVLVQWQGPPFFSHHCFAKYSCCTSYYTLSSPLLRLYACAQSNPTRAGLRRRRRRGDGEHDTTIQVGGYGGGSRERVVSQSHAHCFYYALFIVCYSTSFFPSPLIFFFSFYLYSTTLRFKAHPHLLSL